jgi:protein-S-isoprenylcysteine O-methyltransferase Ste14/uncharacterized membrane protein (UPF0127 family)
MEATIAMNVRPRPVTARAVTNGRELASDLRLAHTHWARLRGLLGTSTLEPGAGLWLKPCHQIHMLGMRYAIDVVFLDEHHRVVETLPAFAPGKISGRVRGAASVLELPSGTLARVPLDPGDRVNLEIPSDAEARSGALEAALCNLVLAALYVVFVVAHLHVARRTGQWTTILPVVAQEALLVALFLTRRRSRVASSRPFDWALGIVGTFLPLLLRASDLGPLTAVGRPLQIGGITLAGISALFLGRSIGVVAANRGVRTAGPYGWVRHPMYVAHVLAYVGYTLSYPSPRNVVIAAVTTAALVGRAVVEERLLVTDPAYRSYLDRIRWRFVPFVH